MMNPNIQELKKISLKIRGDVLRMITEAGSGHPGGSFSSVDVLVVLYFHVLKHNPDKPNLEDRDRIILSKGHAAPALYAILAESGYFPKYNLSKFRKYNSILQGHPDRNLTPGIELSTGSLGNGLSISCGYAAAAKLDKKNFRVYCLLGDGECQEGLVWEAAMFASHYQLENLCAIIDRNGLQIDGPTESVMSLESLANKWRAFNWHVIEVDGHQYNQLIEAFREAQEYIGEPTVIIVHTIKGRGTSFMEWVQDFHGKAPTRGELAQALRELQIEDDSR